jgi:hypothetical protein
MLRKEVVPVVSLRLIYFLFFLAGWAYTVVGIPLLSALGCWRFSRRRLIFLEYLLKTLLWPFFAVGALIRRQITWAS